MDQRIRLKRIFGVAKWVMVCAVICNLWACNEHKPAVQQSSQETLDAGSSSNPIQNVDLNIEVVETPESDHSPDWQQYIASHTQGWIPAVSQIKIQFHHALTEKKALNQPVTGIKISPEIPFKAYFNAENEITISPEKRLNSGESYKIHLDKSVLTNPPAELDSYQFQVKVLKQDFELKVSGLAPAESKSEMLLSGTVHTVDTVENAVIEQTLEVTMGAQALKVTWDHGTDPLNHVFTVSGIERKEKGYSLDLNYDASGLGVKDKSGRLQIDVPALDQFSVTGVRTNQRPEQYIEVSFSEPLDRNQNLIGLVRLNDEDVRAQINGSRLKVFPNNKMSGPAVLKIEDTLHSVARLQLPEAITKEVAFVSELPGVKFSSRGNIIPPSDNVFVPIDAINTKAVWITAFKVFENNIQQFIQDNSLQRGYIDSDTGRYLWRKKITLPSVPLDQWQRFDIDLNEFMKQHGDSVVRLQLDIDRSTVAIPCANNVVETQQEKLANYDGPNTEEYVDRPNWFAQYYSPNNGYVTYEQRVDPCSLEYYSYYDQKNVSDARYLIVSDMGLMAKKGSDNAIHVLSTSLKSGLAKSGVKVSLYNYQHQLVAEEKTNRSGMALLEAKSRAFYLIAKKGKDWGFLRLPNNESLPTSQFDVAGEKVRKGIKGFIFGEREVWRPGDEIFLTFVLEDKQNNIPKGHPVSLDLFDPRGSKVSTLVNTSPTGQLYPFTLKTAEDAPTGNWRAVVRVGGEYFDKVVKIETITPNRLKVDITPEQNPIKTQNSPIRTELAAQWLNGATAKNLHADVELKLTPMKTDIPGWSQYHFDDPASQFERFQQSVFTGSLDAKGHAAFNLQLKQVKNAPGKLKATFVSRVFEQSGNYSTAIRSAEVLPFEQWVGLSIPKGDGYQNAIARDVDHPVQLITVGSDGKPVAERQLRLQVFQIGWRWWWDQSEENLANYVRSQKNNRLVDEKITTDKQGRATWLLKKDSYDWGRHLVRVCDEQSGHCSGQEVYLGWSWSQQVNPDSATQLMLAADKERYQPGETARITIPELAQGRLVYSLESGSRVLEQQWLDLQPGATHFDLPITAKMAPNVYLNVVLFLPHTSRQSDAPMRLYGVVPILVEDPKSRVSPQLHAPKTVRPESTFDISVNEEQGRPMSYTLAVVDEGLLGVTGYQAPDPHNHFYRREALGVTTWDLFDGVIGAYGANLERLLKIGGGAQGKDKQSSKERRFPPVVKFLGAFHIAAGEQRVHKVTLPPYMGAVRVMLVAAEEGAYGRVEQSITVTQPLTLLATLPRVLGPGEEVDLPVNVFVNSGDIKEVQLQVSANELFDVVRNSAVMQFDAPGDQITSLKLKAKDQIGQGVVTVKAKAGNEETEQTIFIQSRSPNIASTVSEHRLLKPGETWTPLLAVHGMEGSNSTSAVFSRFPPMNLERRMQYLLGYPHGCVEQTTSKIFPQIWLNRLVNLTTEQQDKIQQNVVVAIDKYRRFQNQSGGFSYWPGNKYVNDWASVYATHFLVEADEIGYPVPKNMLDDAVGYLAAISESEQQQYSRMLSAYRHYVMARVNRADLAAMNRLRESLLKRTQYYEDQMAKWLLAMAYQERGISDIAEALLSNSQQKVQDDSSAYYSYGSALRDQSLLLMAQKSLGNNEMAWQLAREIAQHLSSDTWYSTHSTAWSLLAMAQFAQGMGVDKSASFAVSQDGGVQWQAMESQDALFQFDLPSAVLKDKKLNVRNDGDNDIFVQINNTGVPKQGDEQANQAGLMLSTRFTDMAGNELDVSELPQGQDFIAEVSIKSDHSNTRFKIEDIAMNMVFPSGWQIRNQRLEGDQTPDGLDYQDIRDDRVLSYFSLWRDHYWRIRYNDRNQETISIKVLLNASYAGRFYLPGWEVQAMYDANIFARNEGQWVNVVSTAKE